MIKKACERRFFKFFYTFFAVRKRILGDYSE